ncbi:hypothetical protein FS749_015578 [Ceratobasidium sp. UAMH 11750]|nr:hypothetical protein FS749_015578 [Ceratobasidium sp. UAMH 11750]
MDNELNRSQLHTRTRDKRRKGENRARKRAKLGESLAADESSASLQEGSASVTPLGSTSVSPLPLPPPPLPDEQLPTRQDSTVDETSETADLPPLLSPLLDLARHLLAEFEADEQEENNEYDGDEEEDSENDHVPGNDSNRAPTASQARVKERQAAKRQRQQELRNARNLLLFSCGLHEIKDIMSWDPERVLTEAAKVKSSGVISREGRAWIINLDQRVRSRGGDLSAYEGRVPDLSDEKLKSERWTILNRGTVYSYHTNSEGQKILVFAARFQPFAEMTTGDIEEMEFLAYHFWMLGHLFYTVDNGAKRGGVMFAEGWRAGYEVLHRLGLYKLRRNGKGTPEEYAEFILHMERALVTTCGTEQASVY